MSLQCAKCGSQNIIPRAEMIDRGHYDTERKLQALAGCSEPQAWLFKGQVYATFTARICGACGYAELYADNPGECYRTYLAGKGY